MDCFTIRTAVLRPSERAWIADRVSEVREDRLKLYLPGAVDAIARAPEAPGRLEPFPERFELAPVVPPRDPPPPLPPPERLWSTLATSSALACSR